MQTIPPHFEGIYLFDEKPRPQFLA